MADGRIRIGIVGAGRMGRIRALSAHAHKSCTVTLVADWDLGRARSLAAEVGAQPAMSGEEVINSEDVDALVVATPHKFLSYLTLAALRAGKHVFCEKPLARNIDEADEVLEEIKRLTDPGCPGASPLLMVTVGYTLRHHPAVSQAWRWVKEGRIGTAFYILGRYGHGGRPGYEREWRADPEMGGGGELLDQGVHLIDLSRAFLGEFREVSGFTQCFCWGASQGNVEDNAFLLLRTREGKIAALHASWTQWKNLFSFEIFGSDGSIAIDGLGGSYGPERMALVRRKNGGVPDVHEINFCSSTPLAEADVWMREWDSFVARVLPDRTVSSPDSLPPATAWDAREVLHVVREVYDCASGGGAGSPLTNYSPGRRQGAPREFPP